MGRNAFPTEVSDQLGWYVYRLIDPRNGETFYVGKGRGNRVFDHVRDVVVLAARRRVVIREDQRDEDLLRSAI